MSQSAKIIIFSDLPLVSAFSSCFWRVRSFGDTFCLHATESDQSRTTKWDVKYFLNTEFLYNSHYLYQNNFCIENVYVFLILEMLKIMLQYQWGFLKNVFRTALDPSELFATTKLWTQIMGFQKNFFKNLAHRVCSDWSELFETGLTICLLPSSFAESSPQN